MLCRKEIVSRSKFKPPNGHRCHLIAEHEGKCQEFPFLVHMMKYDSRVANKVIRDSTMTTGASWKSEDAGPNRVRRWIMLQSDAELLQYGINMAGLSDSVSLKLREKAAEYEDCILVAQKLTWLVYGMEGCEPPPNNIKFYLEDIFGAIVANTTTCLICKKHIKFDLFKIAKRGKAEIETSHSNPRIHSANNVGFAHRACNIAQGNKTLEEFYTWIKEIIHAA